MSTEVVEPESMVSPEWGAALVRRVRQGDQAAYADLCGRFGGALYRYAASLLRGDQDLAEDVMVGTLTDAIRNINRFDGRKSTLSAWLYGIARRQVIGERRRQARKGSVPASAQIPVEAMADLPDGDDLESGAAARLDAQRQVLHLSRVLSELEMEVLMLHCAIELSAKEIGRVVGRSERAVETIIHRAKRKARESLGSHDE